MEDARSDCDTAIVTALCRPTAKPLLNKTVVSLKIRQMKNLPIPREEFQQMPPATLGDVLYTGSRPSVQEQVWVRLIQSIAAGDQQALRVLYAMSHRIVFTLIVRITANRDTAEELTIDIFHDIWQGASRYDPARGTVLGWIMMQARSRAIDRLRFDNRKRRKDSDNPKPTEEAVADPRDVIGLREQAKFLRAALSELTSDEREAIEITFFAGCTHVEAAERLNQPLGTVKTRIRSGLRKLRDAMSAEGAES